MASRGYLAKRSGKTTHAFPLPATGSDLIDTTTVDVVTSTLVWCLSSGTAQLGKATVETVWA